MTQHHRSRHARPRSTRAMLAGAEPQPVLPAGLAELGAVLAAAVRPTALPGQVDLVPTFAGTTGLAAEPALYAAMGAVAVGQLAAARGTLAALLDAQRPDGRLPSRLSPARGWRARLLRALGRPDERLGLAQYANGVVPTALALWLGAVYVEATGDRQFLQDHHGAFERAAAWLESQETDGLPAADGEAPTLMGGVLVYRALRALGEMAMPRGEAIAAARHWARAASVRERVNARFWDAGRGHYADADAGRANMLAAASGLAARGQAMAILSRAEDGLGLEAGHGFHALAAAEQGEAARAHRALDEALAGELTASAAGRLALALMVLDRPAQARAL